MKLLTIPTIICLLSACSPVNAEPIVFDKKLQQGALVMANLPQGVSKVWLDKREISVLPNNRIMLGFGRDHGKSAILKVKYKNGETEKQALSIASRSYKIQRINGLPKAKVNAPRKKSAQTRITREVREIGAARKPFTKDAMFDSGWIWPAKGRISGVYGSQRVLNGTPKRPHFGVDVAAPTGSPVIAPAGGIVRMVQKDNYYSGGTMIIDHGYKLSSAFLHMNSISAKVGQRVKQGEQVGTVGSTGRATGPHLDWRMNWFNQRIDPQTLVGEMPK